MTQKERMLQGLPYRTSDPELKDMRMEAKKKIYDFNHLRPEEEKKAKELMYTIVGKGGINLHIKTPFYCEYGTNIEIGDNFFSNFNCMILDAARVKIGDNVRFAPNVFLFTSGHPLHPKSRDR
jgi:acetyltransferase-like isoleucine patch superfamily enzyme